MINRENLISVDPSELFGKLSDQNYRTDDEIRDSVRNSLRGIPQGEPVWIFCYGSLIWNPVINFSDRQQGFLLGYERAFCMKMNIGRGSYETPGRMLALIPGKRVDGIFLRIDENNISDELEILWRREMRTSGYHPIWEKAELADGRKIIALTFAMSEHNIYFDPVYNPDYVAEYITKAAGPLGTNKEYLDMISLSLSKEGISDNYINQVTEAVEKLVSL